jgi:proteasome assembly chaperone (PAC2) family protein
MAKSHLAVWTDVQKLKERADHFEQRVNAQEELILRLMEQVNTMQQTKKPGRPPKNAD